MNLNTILNLVKNKRYFILCFFVITIPAYIAINNVLGGGMAFWFDPARDFLLALNNHNKLSLIGSPTGIPGVFYGPYWIWLLSGAQLISYDPRIVTLLILTLPYLTLFPYLLYKITSKINKYLWMLLWLLFSFAYLDYFISPWNPHPAPLITLALIFFGGKRSTKYGFVLGLLSGLIVNFQFSFGLATVFGTILFLIFKELVNKPFKLRSYFKSIIRSILYFSLGLIIVLIPFVAFEIRHGYNQTKSFYKTVTNAVFYNSASVGQTGLSKYQIDEEIKSSFTKLLTLPKKTPVFLLIMLLTLISFYNFQKSSKPANKILLEYCKAYGLHAMSIGVIMYFLYVSSKNPVWPYHFLSVEILFLILIIIIINKSYFLSVIFFIWVFYISFFKLQTHFNVRVNPLSLSSLTTKKFIIDKIYNDSLNKEFTVFTYSPSIYTFDFDYLFLTYGFKKYNYIPKQNNAVNTVYLVIPKTKQEVLVDFINYKTPNERYLTSNIWNIDDGTVIIKRVDQKK